MAGCGGGNEATADKYLECLRGTDAQTFEKRLQSPREAWVSLHRYMGPEVAGILMAEERGYFEDVGLAMTITSGNRPDAPIGYVVDETVEFGLAQQPQLVMAKEEGKPVIAVGALIPRATAAIIWLDKSRMNGIADLEGKTIAFPGLPSQRALLESLLKRAGLTLEDVDLRPVGYRLVPPLVNDRADAIFGGSGNIEGTALEARGLKPVVIPVGSLGIPAYEELVVAARADRAAKNPQLVRDFMSAVARGNVAAVEDPQGAVEAIEGHLEKDPTSDRKATEAGVEATLPLLAKTGCMDPERAARLAGWMSEQGLVRQAPPVSELLTNRYLKPRP